MFGAFTAASTAVVKVADSRTLGEAVDDAFISSKIKSSFIKNGFRKLYTRISTYVSQGRVMYTGKVDSEEDMITAIDIAWKQNGVKEVINHIKIDQDGGKFNAQQYAKDCWITTVVKSRILARKGVKFTNYTIVTYENIVYVFGISRSEEELFDVSDIASRVAGVEKVVNNAKVIENSALESSCNEYNFKDYKMFNS